MSAPSILSTIMRVESGGRNVPQSLSTRDVNNNYGQGGGDPAQGYYQITGGTWNEFGGNKTGYQSAINAPYEMQVQVAQNIPVARWGPATQAALEANGYKPLPGETLGQMLARYGEDATATKPSDAGQGVGTPTAAPTAQLPPPPTASSSPYAGLLAAQTARQEADDEAKQQAKNAAMTKEGLGLLGQATTPAPAVQAAHAQVVVPKQPGVPMPDFLQMLAQQRLQRST